MTAPSWSRLDTIAVSILTAVAAGIRGVALSRPPFIYSDELFYAREACNMVYHAPPLCGIPLDAVSGHPPLGKWLISMGIRALGWQPIGWRAAGLVAGIVTVAALYILARRVLRSTAGAVLASGLLTIDFLHVVQSRIAMLDVILTLFVVAAFLFVVLDQDSSAESMRRPQHGRRPGLEFRPWLIAAGLAGGAAMATKWVGLLALLGAAILGVVLRMSRVAGGWRIRLAAAIRHEWKAMVLAFAVAAPLVYVASYVPVNTGTVITAPWARGSWARVFARSQREMLESQRSSAEIKYLGLTHRSVSPAWSWPLIKRPFVYYSNTRADGHRETIVAMGNPLVWWTAIVAIVALAIRLARRRWSDAAIVAVTGFVVMYAPLLLVSRERSATFLYYLLPSVPFMCLAIATVAVIWPPSRTRTAISVAYVAATVALFAFFRPVLVGAPLTSDELAARQWFRDCAPDAGIAAPKGWCWQ